MDSSCSCGYFMIMVMIIMIHEVFYRTNWDVSDSETVMEVPLFNDVGIKLEHIMLYFIILL
jgi:hypothetical protein